MSFSYNSAVQFSKSVSDVFDFADQLLECILAASADAFEQQSRPIIFICHSLGGIVFKQALIRAHEDQRYAGIRSQIKGVCFFGTPHRGSDMAKWASIVGAIVKTASMARSTNTGLSKDLTPGSRVLRNISRSFIERSSELPIYSFFETLKMDFMNDVVVDQESAVIGLGNEVKIPIDGNHRTICRFSDPEESRYRPVITNLVRLVNEVLQKSVAADHDPVLTMLESFTFPDLRQHKARNPSPLPGTCTWLFDHPLYTDWFRDCDSSLLWVSADPRCGKSVIASHLINTKMGFSKTEKVDLCYFFFKTDYPDQRSAVVALQGLLLQLFNCYPALKKCAAEFLDGRSPESINNLWEVFVRVALKRRTTDDTSVQRTFCILDGLDECDERDRRTLTRLISQTFEVAIPKSQEKTALDHSDKTTSIKMLILSRPDNAIKVAFDKPKPPDISGHIRKSRAAMIRLRGEDETRAIGADVARVIDASINAMIEQGLPRDLLKDVQKELVQRADRTFLWVTLILQLLAEKVESGVSQRELLSILDNRDIDKLYGELLMMRPEVEKARKALNILLAAVKPLTLAQMSIALAIKPDHDILRRSDQPRRPNSSTMQDLEDNLNYPFETHLKFICGNFIRIIHEKVYLVHETARAFLLENWSAEHHNAPSQGSYSLKHSTRTTTKSRNDALSVPQETSDMLVSTTSQTIPIHMNDPWKHSFTLLESKSLMLQICTTFLYMMGKKTTINILGEPSEEAYDFLIYAALSWWRHFGDARELIETKDVRYYENLCHPKFPAFTAWTKALLGPDRMTSIRTARSVDEIQDYMVGMLGIELACTNKDGHDSSSEGRATENEENTGDDVEDFSSTPRALVTAIENEAITRLSSNPASQNNSYFPLRVGENGFVTIDFRAKGQSVGRVG